MGEARVAGLGIHPVKSAAALRVDAAELGPRGFTDDRRWLVVDKAGAFLTQRTHPRMCLLRAAPTPGGLRLEAAGMPRLDVRTPATAERRPVEIWGTRWRRFRPASTPTPG